MRRIHTAALLALVLGACTRLVPVRIPVQLARVTQTEEYEQVFRFQPPPGDPSLYEELQRVFTKLIGKENWKNVRDAHSDKMKQIRQGQARLRGRISASIYLHPTRHEFVVIEGSGRYHMLDWKGEANPEILLSGDFVIASKCHEIRRLAETKRIVVDVTLFLSHVPAQRHFLEKHDADLATAATFLVPARYHEVALQYELDFVPDSRDERVYLVRYRDPNGDLHPHRVLLEGEHVADMFLLGAHSNYKILDLRGLDLLQTDYSKVLDSVDVDATGCSPGGP